MIRFETHEQLKEIYDKGKYDIYYKNNDINYDVSHIGSTIYCRNTEKGMGMGAIHNFPIEYFYGVEKPKIEEIIEYASDEKKEDLVD